MSAKRVAQGFVAVCALLASVSMVGAETTDTAAGTGTAPLPGAAASQPLTVADGPLEPERKLLLSRIELAKKHGIGTSVYMTEFKKVEEEVKAGATGDQIKGRVESLTRSLAEQLQRGRNLKTQRPIPAAGAHGGAGDGGTTATASAPDAGKGGGGGGSGSLADKLKSITNDLPPGTLEKIMQNDKARNILERLK